MAVGELVQISRMLASLGGLLSTVPTSIRMLGTLWPI